MDKKDYVWYDRKHFMWFPWSFTTYYIHNNRLYCKKGLLSTKSDELLLYRVTDISLNRSLAQKIFGTGTITINTKSDSSNVITLTNIKKSEDVQKLLSDLVEESRDSKRISGKEIYSSDINIYGE